MLVLKPLNRLVMAATVVLSGIMIVACSSEPKVAELSNTVDIQDEIHRVDGNIHQARSQQVDVLSPDNFERAKSYWDKAVAGRANNKNQKTVLHDLALSQSYLNKASNVASVGQQILKDPIQARQDALKAGAGKYYPEELKSADKDLRKVTSKIENNDTSLVDARRQSLDSIYRDIELRSIKKDKLGEAQITLQNAIKEGAKKFAPQTLAWAEKQLAEDESSIEQNRHDTAVLEKSSQHAVATANRLLKIVRVAKGSDAQNSEELALQMEKSEMATEESNKDLAQSESNLSNSERNLARSSASNRRLESELSLDKKYESARRQFTKEEAEVYKQGGKLLLRLKGLSFANNKSVLGSKNFTLLAKVQKVIQDVGPSQIVIEGHTDSVGGQKTNESLSTQRAESVMSYLVSNKNIAADKISSQGLGYTKPIATNKTASGRAQNRRVDIIIDSETTN
ncbi:MAG: OmpA family protein [Pseudobdellovibrionaceae bacterium]